MTSTKFYLTLNIRTSDDFHCVGKFFLGSDVNFAENIFRKLKGNKKISRDTFLNLEFVETKNDLPQNVQVIGCTLDELGENCKIITKEAFKFLNMEDV